MNLDNFLFVIPARKGSKGIKKKNLIKLKKKHLVEYTFKIIEKLNIKNSYVITDDNLIKKIAHKYNVNTEYKRPKKLSGDRISLIENLKHFKKFIDKKINYKYFIILQPTSPFRTYEDVLNSIKKFKKGRYSSLFSVSDSIENPYESVYLKKKKNFLLSKKNIK